MTGAEDWSSLARAGAAARWSVLLFPLAGPPFLLPSGRAPCPRLGPQEEEVRPLCCARGGPPWRAMTQGRLTTPREARGLEEGAELGASFKKAIISQRLRPRAH